MQIIFKNPTWTYKFLWPLMLGSWLLIFFFPHLTRNLFYLNWAAWIPLVFLFFSQKKEKINSTVRIPFKLLGAQLLIAGILLGILAILAQNHASQVLFHASFLLGLYPWNLYALIGVILANFSRSNPYSYPEILKNFIPILDHPLMHGPLIFLRQSILLAPCLFLCILLLFCMHTYFSDLNVLSLFILFFIFIFVPQTIFFEGFLENCRKKNLSLPSLLSIQAVLILVTLALLHITWKFLEIPILRIHLPSGNEDNLLIFFWLFCLSTVPFMGHLFSQLIRDLSTQKALLWLLVPPSLLPLIFNFLLPYPFLYFGFLVMSLVLGGLFLVGSNQWSDVYQSVFTGKRQQQLLLPVSFLKRFMNVFLLMFLLSFISLGWVNYFIFPLIAPLLLSILALVASMKKRSR